MIGLGVVGVGIAIALAGCGGAMSKIRGDEGLSFPLQIREGVLPAAQGAVTVKSQKDGRQQVRVEVKHLAPIEAVMPESNAYVAWLQPTAQDAPPVNIGTLIPNKDLKATLETETPFREFEVFVTAEKNARVTEPSNQQMMTASVRTRTTY